MFWSNWESIFVKNTFSRILLIEGDRYVSLLLRESTIASRSTVRLYQVQYSYIYSKDKRTIRELSTKTRAGSGCINHNVVHYSNHNLPFGGINNSGAGKSHGYYGFLEFSNQRSIVRQYTPSTAGFVASFATSSVKRLQPGRREVPRMRAAIIQYAE